MSGKSDKTEAVEKAEPDSEEAAPKKKIGRKKKPILLAAPILFVGVVAVLWFTGVLPNLIGLKHGDQARPEAVKYSVPVFVDLPDMISNLASPPNKPTYLKLQARLEVSKQEDIEKVKQAMPRLQDMFQTYLREMRAEELRSSAGIYRLREELLGRANVALAPVKVNDVLFTQLLIQ